MVLRARPGRDEGEQAVVHRLASARKAPKDVVERCRMVELSWDGWLVPQIADELRCGQKTVRRWLHRFNRSGLEGLEDPGGQGRKRRIAEAERSRIVGLVKQTRPGGSRCSRRTTCGPRTSQGPRKTLDTLAAGARDRGIEVSRSQVRRILLAEGVRWRRTRSWTPSRDADFEGKGRGSSSSTPARPSARRSSAPTSSAR
ncbi:helix-turn-helix domain-containing protein [Streptomyces actinomycinicus]|uniref:helix-turn-helix domain-containing protein n=1 Tax=Streptomyces actinomycinicus TaxID=1695166 RepID=UPI001F363C5E|nr:helix-turn-helix domain-containing protein [Streptomyces actinomycinicus]